MGLFISFNPTTRPGRSNLSPLMRIQKSDAEKFPLGEFERCDFLSGKKPSGGMADNENNATGLMSLCPPLLHSQRLEVNTF